MESAVGAGQSNDILWRSVLEVLRVVKTTTEKGPLVVLKVEGRLVEQWVNVLATECLGILEQRKQLDLDLAGVSFADDSGVTTLRDLTARGVRIGKMSAFLEELLEGDAR